tara:strand:- start:384 stop:1070 length:687 start_codon:yes stop_codon:yes gene_type:complete
MPILFSDSSSLTTAPAGGGEWTKASTTTLSGSNSVQDFDLDFSTYKQWKIVGENIACDQQASGFNTGFALRGTTAHSSGSYIWLLGQTSGYAHYQKWEYTVRKWGNQNSSNGATHYYRNDYENVSDSDNGEDLGQSGNFHNFEITTNDWSLTNGKSDAIPKWWGWWSTEENEDDEGADPKHAFNHFSGSLTHHQGHSATHPQNGFRLDFARGQSNKTFTGKIYIYRRT